jgi:hypothetical protein
LIITVQNSISENMKNKSIKLLVSLILMFVVSCNEPETVVTNIVHPDGSVTRRIVMKSTEKDKAKRFKLSELQVQYDNTWTVKDSSVAREKSDTLWVRTAEKLFKNVEEINLAYKKDSGPDKEVKRHAEFKRSFRWFNTEYRFSENIDKKLLYGYPLKDYLNSEELLYYYSPDDMKEEKKTSPDSLKYKMLNDSIGKKTDRWLSKNIVSEWIEGFSALTAGKQGNISKDSLKAREDEFVKIIGTPGVNFDSLWQDGVILRKFIGSDNALKFKAEADTALEHVTENLLLNFRDYSIQTVMPGKLVNTNGYIDSSHVLLWPVKSDYFLSENYEMWAVSRVPNRWAWIISGIFLAFVAAGVMVRVIKKD